MPGDAAKLRQLAAWYREFAERAGNPAIWEARLRTAENLEAEADQRDRRAMKSAEELRTEACRLRETVKSLSDPQLKKELASRALGLSQRAEAIANSIEDPEIIPINISRLRSLLAGGISDASHRQTVEEMLADAETMLTNSRIRDPGGDPDQLL